MRLVESLRVALSALLANRLRSALTMLGIVIGVAAVIALVSLGQGFQRYVNNQFQALGSNLIMVFPANPGGPNARTVKPKPLTMDDARAIANPIYVSDVQAVAPEFSVSSTVTANANSLGMGVTGTIPAWSQVRDWAVADGRFIEDTDIESSARVVVLGATTVAKLLDPGSEPVGQLIRINNIPFRVIGVLVTKGGVGNADQVAIVPISTAQTRLSKTSALTSTGAFRVSDILTKADSDQTAPQVRNDIQSLLTERHNVQFVGQEDFRVISQDQILSTVDNVTNLLTLFLGLIAGISLLVGGIGVMNIMLVSVTERTREIGLRKAVGARYLDLMAQFLIESISLSVGGGLIGILFGMLIDAIATQFIPNLTLSVTVPAIILATGVSTAIGLFFGLYPASRAATLSPIEALRYE